MGADPESPPGTVLAGRIVGLFGVGGWVKVFSYTQPRDNIVKYDPWLIESGDGWQEIKLDGGRAHGKGVVAKLKGVDDRDAAMAFQDAHIAIRRGQFAALAEGEYYWADLIGLSVITLDDRELGVVTGLYETGANAVLAVKGERVRMVPFIHGTVVCDVNLDAGMIRVDWDPDF